jgi:GDPmannose 4,6-dehydratase
MDMVWQRKGDHEKGYDQKTGQLIVEVDSIYFRPTEVDQLLTTQRFDAMNHHE